MYRDKETGKKMTLEEANAARDAAKKKKESKWERPEWGVGLKQQRQAEAQQAEMAAEAARPFARSRCVKCSMSVP